MYTWARKKKCTPWCFFLQQFHQLVLLLFFGTCSPSLNLRFPTWRAFRVVDLVNQCQKFIVDGRYWSWARIFWGAWTGKRNNRLQSRRKSEISNMIKVAVVDSKVPLICRTGCCSSMRWGWSLIVDRCLKVKEMDDEEYSYAALQEPLYRVETGNYEYRSVNAYY